MNNDMPGMMGIAQGVANQTWPHTIDAQVWANEWIKTIAEHPEIATELWPDTTRPQ